MQGKVDMFKPERGYGFIRGDTGESYFVYHRDIMMDGFRMLERGKRVIFDVKNTSRGKQAVKVKQLD